jgi:hypothetical protein
MMAQTEKHRETAFFLGEQSGVVSDPLENYTIKASSVWMRPEH